MALTKRTYVANSTKITAANLNDIQDAIINLENDVKIADSSLSDSSTNPVQNKAISSAINKLSLNNPIDISTDYTSSGAKDVITYFTMADSTDTSKYKLKEGYYKIQTSSTTELIRITDYSAIRWIFRIENSTDDFMYLYVYSCTSPGSTAAQKIYFSDEESLFNINTAEDNFNFLLPAADKSYVGKFLRVNSNGHPEWQSLTNVAEEGA